MFITNHDQISAEIFENEIVAIHFLKGTYFSLRGASLPLWSWLQPGADEATLVRLLAARYSLDTPTSREAIAKALTALLQSELIIDSDRPMPPDDAYDLAIGPRQYEEAVIECFEDLQELIAIDPVHEVDPMQGWPHRPPSITLD